MVAKKITVNTKKYGEDTAYCWQSSGADGYTISEIEKENAGTEIILEIKDNTDEENYDEFLEQFRDLSRSIPTTSATRLLWI
jgi:molecular chaperone HtpG